MKIGRNDPCDCGSGKKYKKCCLRMNEGGWRFGTPEEAAMMAEYAKELERKKPEPHMALVPSVVHAGHRFRTLYNRLHWRPLQETFHEFIYFVLSDTFGEEWAKKQLTLPTERQHIVMRWHLATLAWQRANMTEVNRLPNGPYTAVPSGDAQSLLLLAYDLYCLQQVNKLPAELVDRLRDHREFQGARYEVAVAAMMIRSGFTIEYIEPVEGQKICEFIATRKGTDERIAVEAKSRRRSGVLNEKGVLDPSALDGDVKGLYKNARKKRPDLPYIIFIDMNLPSDVTASYLKDIQRMMHSFPIATPEAPSPHSALVLTNFGCYTYAEDKPVLQHEPFTLIQHQHCKHPISKESRDAIYEGVGRYPILPDEV